MTSDADWSQGYAVQAAADWECWQLLKSRGEIPECQALHFLQMACEKLVKAHLFDSGGDNPDRLRSEHAVIRKHLKTIVACTINRVSPTLGKSRRGRELTQFANQLAAEIEVLSPNCKGTGGQRADNCEYPWDDGLRLRIPARHHFDVMARFNNNWQANEFQKLVKVAIDDLAISDST